ncbi:hypothetical protein ABT224_13295 [Streptomyces sp. NPDC001584]|uniref:hypothetical protein n=1 Tax=Streptomyces sp. NPDC001584 TaxID=3154521 RepID=UPI00332059E7
MSEQRRTATSAGLHMPRRNQGQDPAWDRLGDDWQAVEGVIPEGRVYIQWTQPEAGSPYLSGICLADRPITSDLLRSIPVGRLENLARAKNGGALDEGFSEDLEPLKRQAGQSPEDFAERVAWYYENFARLSSKPAKLISDHSGVPLPTVHGWIREARLRGKLPPGRRGKAG